MSGKMGGSDLRGTMAVDQGKERTLLKADVISDNLLGKDVGTFIGARPAGQKGTGGGWANGSADRRQGASR